MFGGFAHFRVDEESDAARSAESRMDSTGLTSGEGLGSAGMFRGRPVCIPTAKESNDC
jgi:hypothetical protein